MQSRFALRIEWLLPAIVAGAVFFFAQPASAENKAVESQARALMKRAMDEDYLATEFDKAVDKLNQAVAKCGTDKCSAPLRAQLKRDLGVVHVGQGKREAGVASFVEAIKIDPSLQLDPDLKTKEIDSAWEEARQKAGKGGGAPPAGDFTHTAAPTQQVRTPLPIYVEYGGSEPLARVMLKYKAFGMTEWKSLELKKIGEGYGAEIPCADVQQGDVQYYIQGFNAQNDPVATGGDRNNPYRTTIRKEPAGEPPHLPGREPPSQCADAGDCPPDFPGCKKGGAEGGAAGKEEGADCEEDSECASGVCTSSKTCGGGEASPKKAAKIWIGVTGELDVMLLPAANDVCLLNYDTALPVNGKGYYCTNDDGSDFPTRPPADATGSENKSIYAGKSDKITSGFATGNIRVMLSVDWAFNRNMMLGARFGYVFNRYPGTAASNDGKTFAPIHAELRYTYVFGKDALAKKGLAPYVYGSGGASQWDAKVAVPIVLTTDGTTGNAGKTVQGWNIAGPGFVSLGGGLRYAFTPRSALFLGPRFTYAFGNSGAFVISPELNVAVGF